MKKINYILFIVLIVLSFLAIKAKGNFLTIYTIISVLAALYMFPISLVVSRSIYNHKTEEIIFKGFCSSIIAMTAFNTIYPADYLSITLLFALIISIIFSFYFHNKKNKEYFIYSILIPFLIVQSGHSEILYTP